MISDENTKQAKEKAKESSKKLFKKRPKDIQKEFERETTLGRPENLIKPDNKNE